MANGGIEKNVTVKVRTDADELSGKLALALEDAKARMAALQKSIVEGSVSAGEAKGEWTALAGQINFFTKQIAALNSEQANHEKSIQSTIVSLHGLEVAGIKYADSLAKIKQAEREADQAAATTSQHLLEHLNRVEAAQRERAERRQRNKDADLDEGFESAKAQQQIDGLGDIANAYERASRSGDEFNKVVNAGASYAKKAQAGFFDWHTTVNTATASTDAATRASGKFGYAMLNVSHAFQDLQYGIGAVLNNIPLVVQAFGGGPGLAGGIMIAAVAADVLAPKLASIIDVTAIFGGKVADVRAQVVTLKERISELESKPVKLTVDDVELRNARKTLQEIQDALQAVERLRKSQAHYEKESGLEIDTILAENNGPEIHKKLREQFINERLANDEKLKEARRETEEYDTKARELASDIHAEPGAAASAKATADEARERAFKRREVIMEEGGEGDKELGKLLTKAKEGSGREQARAQEELARRLDKAGTGLGGSVRSVTPESLFEMDKVEEEFEAGVNNVKKWGEQQKKSRDLGATLTQQGLHNEKLDRDEQERKDKQAKDERDTRVRRDASRVGSAMDGNGPESLDSAIAGRVSNKQSDAQISTGLTPQVLARVKAAGVDRDIADDVAKQIVGSAVARVRAMAVGRSPDVNEGAERITEEAKGRGERAKDADAKRQQGRQQRAFRGQIAAGMQNEYGLSAPQAMAIAPEVEANMKKGMDPGAAGRAAIAKLEQFINHQQNTINGMQANQEAMAGVFGQAMQTMARQQAMNASVNQSINRAARGAMNGAMPIIPPR